MSQQEFDTYLSLLCRLLRIAPQQREQVAEEFRTHMEDRLEELLSSGKGRDEAVRLALEEFGDAAGLAAQIASIFQGRRKRWIMRIGTVSVAGLAAAGLLAVALWPEGVQVKAPQVVAQTFKAEVPEEKTVKGQPEKSIEEKLAQRIDADYPETPLKEVLEDLRERAGMQIYVNTKAIVGAIPEALDTPITLNLKQVRFGMVLDLVLEQAGESQLAYVERDGILIISTGDALAGASEVKVYNCRDLLAMASPVPQPAGMMGGWGHMGVGGGMPAMPGGSGFAVPALPGAEAPHSDPQHPEDSPRTTPPPGGGSPKLPSRTKGAPPPSESSIQMLPKRIHAQFGGGGMGGGMGGGGGRGGEAPRVPRTEEEIRAERLMHLITTAVKPDSWQDMGGFGTISEYKGLIVINHNARTHKEVENVLKMLREAAGLPDSGPVGGMMELLMKGGMPPPIGGHPVVADHRHDGEPSRATPRLTPIHTAVQACCEGGE